MMDVPILGEQNRRITIFGGKLRTGSPGEFVLTGIIAFFAFIVLGSLSLDTERRNWQELHRKGIADRKEYYTSRLNFFLYLKTIYRIIYEICAYPKKNMKIA